MKEETKSLPDKIVKEIACPVFVCAGHHCHGCIEPFLLSERQPIIKCILCVKAIHDNDECLKKYDKSN